MATHLREVQIVDAGPIQGDAFDCAVQAWVRFCEPTIAAIGDVDKAEAFRGFTAALFASAIVELGKDRALLLVRSVAEFLEANTAPDGAINRCSSSTEKH